MPYSYVREIMDLIGPGPALVHLLRLITHFKEKAKKGEGVTEDWGNGLIEAEYVITLEDIKPHNAFKHLWGHKIIIILDGDTIIDHTFVEQNCLGIYD